MLNDLRTYRNLLQKFLHPLPIIGVIIFVMIFSITPANAQVQAPKTNAPTLTGPIPTYPESPEGLKKLVADLFAIIKAGDNDRAAAYYKELAIPDDVNWFANVFGAEEGLDLEAKYLELLPSLATDMQQNFGSAVSEGRTDVAISVFQKPLDPKIPAGLERSVIEAMAQPVKLYVVSTSSSQARSITIGQFFYVQGGFRYADSRVLMALRTAPPSRVTVSGLGQQAKLIHKIDPVYPEQAKEAHIDGVVSLRAIISADGSVREIKVIRGDPTLAQAAVDVVRLWEYQPTIINGKPVEVETTITVPFRLPIEVDSTREPAPASNCHFSFLINN